MDLLSLKSSLDYVVNSFLLLVDLDINIMSINPVKIISGSNNIEKFIDNYEFKGFITLRPDSECKLMSFFDIEYTLKQSNIEDIESHYIMKKHIKVNNENIGCIIITSSNKKQAEYLKNNTEFIKKYLIETSDYISESFKWELKVCKDSILQNQMTTVFDFANVGLVIYSDDEGIKQMNTKAKQLLHYEDLKIYNILIKDMIDLVDSGKLLSDFSTYNLIYRIIDETIYTIDIHAKVLEERSESKSVAFMMRGYEKPQKIVKLQQKYIENENMIITQDKSIIKIREKIQTICNYDSNIFIGGESGTGKELFAREIHYSSNRRNKPFVVVNCAAIPENLLESELFGYEEGSFTGAKKGGREGKFILANNGTLFLDEIGDMPLSLQAKLLRVLSDHKVDKIGSDKLIDINVRIISATNKNLEEMIRNNEFREDLYYRLNVIPIHIPPLRERRDDILLVASHYVNIFNKKFNKNILGLSQDVVNTLNNYDWPGNVRELKNYIEYMVSFENKEIISIDNLPFKIKEYYKKNNDDISSIKSNGIPFKMSQTNMKLKDVLRMVEKQYLDQIISNYEQPLSLESIKEICQTVDISIAGFYRKIK
jgi:transcriptional regulator with PAS, ATPase and Fis domain